MTKREEHIVKRMAELVKVLLESALDEGTHASFLCNELDHGVADQETGENNLKRAMDRIVWAISKDLGKPFQRALEVRGELTKASSTKSGSGLVPPPPAAEQSQDVKSRLLRLEDLKQKGLITPEEYKTHREEILKGL